MNKESSDADRLSELALSRAHELRKRQNLMRWCYWIFKTQAKLKCNLCQSRIFQSCIFLSVMFDSRSDATVLSQRLRSRLFQIVEISFGKKRLFQENAAIASTKQKQSKSFHKFCMWMLAGDLKLSVSFQWNFHFNFLGWFLSKIIFHNLKLSSDERNYKFIAFVLSFSHKSAYISSTNLNPYSTTRHRGSSAQSCYYVSH